MPDISSGDPLKGVAAMVIPVYYFTAGVKMSDYFLRELPMQALPHVS
ncbi:MAG: hypothetical protein U5L72_02220 [Bacteroidales bacterium]|nr:hypothetical protein [Bacteroidales bacterium]